jgi:TBC1 domain family member 2B
LLGAHVDQYVFRDLLGEKLPKVHEVLEKHGIEISLFSWFLTCFVDNIPVEVYLRIWDIFLYEGNKVLFRFALAFFKMYEDEILSSSDSLSINTLLRTLGETGCDVKTLCRIAFSFLNPFPMNRVRQKRAHYTTVVKTELERLEQLRMNLPSCGEGSSPRNKNSSSIKEGAREDTIDSEDRDSDY